MAARPVIANRRLQTQKASEQSLGLLRQVAWFRYQLRRFLRFSENAARASGLTPQQHQLLLGVAGYTGRGWATISELAEFLQERHNAVVGLVERAANRKLVCKEQSAQDRRFVRVRLTPQGEAVLRGLTLLNREERERLRAPLLTAASVSPRSLIPKPDISAGRTTRGNRRERNAKGEMVPRAR